MSKQRKSTMVELVDELKRLTPPKALDHLYKDTIAEALKGEYHDFKNDKYVCGKVAVVGRLHQLGFTSLAKRVVNGEFDEEADEQDKAEMKRAALAGGFTEAQCKTLLNL